VLLAYDALHDITPAGRLFSHGFWEGNPYLTSGKESYAGMLFTRRTPALERSGG